MRLGLIAPEFPPMLGGMAELARGLATALAATDDVRLYSLPGTGLAGPWKPGGEITGRPWLDAKCLASQDLAPACRARGVDLWLLMNAGLVPLAHHLEQPVFAYFHGNDFTNPWLACGPRAIEAIRRPYAARWRHALRRRAIATALPAVRHVMTNSQQTAALIEQRLPLAKARLSVVYPGVADVFFQGSEPRTDEPRTDELRLFTVTRLSSHTRRKNVDGVLEAIASLGNRLPVSYTVVGDGDDRGRLEALSERLGIADRVRFLGSVDLETLLAAYRRADLFILASKATLNDVEGFGIVYLEASASGVPSLCSRAGGATDAVEDGRNGILVDDSSPAAIAAGIERFASERHLFSAEKVRAFAEEFRWPKIAARLRDVLVRHL